MSEAKMADERVNRWEAAAFSVAWCWLLLAAGFALLLRWIPLQPIEGLNLNHLRHAHSHIAFLGWVFNAFYAISLQQFVPPGRRRAFGWLFVILQVAVLGMAATFPFQGYAAGSIVFSTLHMVGSAVFAGWLWKSPRVSPEARPWLRWALAFMLLSGLGPLALGPLAANDLRTHPAYTLSIYFYLHCQYNGWFILFLFAAVVEKLRQLGLQLEPHRQTRAVLSLGIGTALGYALSTLWLDPPWPVWVAAVVGGLLQLYGASLCWPLLGGAWKKINGRDRLLIGLPLGCLLFKLLLQILATLPAWVDLAYHRFVAIAFLHLIFLGIVTPALGAWALRSGWIRSGKITAIGASFFLLGASASELILATVPLAGWGAGFAFEILFASAVSLLLGIGLVSLRLRV